MAQKKIYELPPVVPGSFDILPVSDAAGGQLFVVTVADLVQSGLILPIIFTTGSGKTLRLRAADGWVSGYGGTIELRAGSGAGANGGGNIVLRPGPQGTSGGDGKVIIYDAAAAFGGMIMIAGIGSGFGWDSTGGNTIRSGLRSSNENGTAYVTLRAAQANCISIDAVSQVIVVRAGANAASRLLFTAGSDSETSTGFAALSTATTGVLTVRDGQASVAGGSLSFPSATTAIAANTNDLALTGSAFQRLNCTSASNLTGIAPPSGGTHVDGRMIRVYNVGTANLTLTHNSGLSTTANRYWNSTAADIVLAPNDYAELIYDSTSNGSGAAGWRVS